MANFGYLRVSKQEQRPDRQIDGLKNLCDKLFIETLSAVSKKRPVYDALVRKMRPGDKLIVWDLDRAFRSVLDALKQADRLMQRGIDFEIVSLPVDTATPEGRLVYTMMSAVAEFERQHLIRRTREGLASARLRGTLLGRRSKLSDEQLIDARRRLTQTEEKVAHIAKEFSVAPWTLTRALRRYANNPRAKGATSETSK